MKKKPSKKAKGINVIGWAVVDGDGTVRRVYCDRSRIDLAFQFPNKRIVRVSVRGVG